MHNLRNEPSYIVQLSHTFEKKKRTNIMVLFCAAKQLMEFFFNWLL